MNRHSNETDLEKFCRITDLPKTKPNNRFDSLGIDNKFIRVIKSMEFKSPTPVQKKAIPVGISGDDIIGIAQTGSGKTIAFGIPMLQRLIPMQNGIGLVLVPTRELALQVEESLLPFTRAAKMKSTVLIGGASIFMQRAALKRNPRVIIATPGRLIDHVDRGNLYLGDVEVFVLDEADRMLDMGFVPDIKRVIGHLPESRQTMLFSATMPREIEKIARQLMETPTRIEIDRAGITPSEISHELYFVNNMDKCRLLAVQLKQRSGPVLVFTRTKWMASKLTTKIQDMGFKAAQIHSDRSQEQRRRALEGFKSGRYQTLIATDIAARGIDVTGIELVVNYDMPANSEDYVHRTGRTGRAGKTGQAVSYATSNQKQSVRQLERFLKSKLSILAPPALPTERSLFKEGGISKFAGKMQTEVKQPEPQFPKKRAPERKDFKKRDAKKYFKKRTETDEFIKNDPGNFARKRSEAKRKDSPKKIAKPFSKIKPEVNDERPRKKSSSRKKPTSKKPATKKSTPVKSKSLDFNHPGSERDSAKRDNFRKKRSKKKGGVGQGSKRKKRTRR